MNGTMEPTRFKVATLKEICSNWGIPTSGSKFEIIRRLQEADPSGKWLAEANTFQPIDQPEDIDDHGTMGVSTNQGQRQGYDEREVEFLRRERDIMQRELELLRFFPANLQTQQPQRHIIVNIIKDLLSD